MNKQERERLNKMIAEVDAEVELEGGSTGSNLAEPPYVPPGPVEIPDYLPEEEKARRRAALEDCKNISWRKNKA